MSVTVQSDLVWMNPPPLQLMQRCASVRLVGASKFSISIPIQIIFAKSSFLNLVLSDLCTYDTVESSIYIPSASTSTLKIVGDILTRGESSTFDGLNQSIRGMKEVKSLLQDLGISIKIGPKLITGQKTNSMITSGNKSVKGSKTIKECWTFFKDDMSQDYVARKNSISKKKYKEVNRRRVTDLTDDIGMINSSEIGGVEIQTEKQNFYSNKSSSASASKNEVTGTGGSKCKYCSCTFSSNQSLKRHIVNEVCVICCPLCQNQRNSEHIMLILFIAMIQVIQKKV